MVEDARLHRARRWFSTHTFRDEAAIDRVAALKVSRGVTVSVVLPALNEAATIGKICRVIVDELMPGIVDELIVVDSGSQDDTRELAEAAGAKVHDAGEAELRFGARGKGAAMWTGLGAASGDIVAWLDSDNRSFSSRFVTGLLAPLLSRPELVFVKGFYRRPLVLPGGAESEGARVTELTARPLLQLLRPELAWFVQPLAGECAGLRRELGTLGMLSDYGVDVGLLIDVVDAYGLERTAQADLGERFHRNRDLPALGRTAHQVAQAILARSAPEITASVEPFVQFTEAGSPDATDLALVELPPLEPRRTREAG